MTNGEWFMLLFLLYVNLPEPEPVKSQVIGRIVLILAIAYNLVVSAIDTYHILKG